MHTITPSQLPTASSLLDNDVFIVQQGTLVGKTNYSTMRQAIVLAVQAYVNQELTTEYANVISSISSLTNALAQKANSTHTHSKADVGLSLVENIAPLDMPVSNAMQALLDLKMDAANFTATALAISGTRDW